MSTTKGNQNQGEGDRASDKKYRDDVQRFLATNDPEKIARQAEDELEIEELENEPTAPHPRGKQAGKIGWALLWLLGVPLPVLIIIYLIRGH